MADRAWVKFLIGLAFPVVNEEQAVVVGKMLLVEDRDIVMFSSLTHRTVLSFSSNGEYPRWNVAWKA